MTPHEAPPPTPPRPPEPPVEPEERAPPPPRGSLAEQAVAAHNRVRARVGVPGLAWKPELARLAQDWARHLCRSGRGLDVLQHRPSRPGGPGENLWEGANSEAEGYPIAEAVENWASERRYFDARSGRCRGGVCGHYTQVVWRDTTHVGCGVATCPVQGLTATVWVCNYSPAGNVMGERPY